MQHTHPSHVAQNATTDMQPPHVHSFDAITSLTRSIASAGLLTSNGNAARAVLRHIKWRRLRDSA